MESSGLLSALIKYQASWIILHGFAWILELAAAPFVDCLCNAGIDRVEFTSWSNAFFLLTR
jgi:hypothetical protein